MRHVFSTPLRWRSAPCVSVLHTLNWRQWGVQDMMRVACQAVRGSSSVARSCSRLPSLPVPQTRSANSTACSQAAKTFVVNSSLAPLTSQTAAERWEEPPQCVLILTSCEGPQVEC